MFPNFQRPLAAKLCIRPPKRRCKNVLEVLYHRAKFGEARISPAVGVAKNVEFFKPSALPAAQSAGYLIYSEADFGGFRPAWAKRCTDGGEIWHGGGDRREGTFGSLLHAKFHPTGATTRV